MCKLHVDLQCCSQSASFQQYELDPSEQALLARDYKGQGEFSVHLNRCIEQCYVRRRGIEDPRMDPNTAASQHAKLIAKIRSRLGAGKSKKKPGIVPLAPLEPER